MASKKPSSTPFQMPLRFPVVKDGVTTEALMSFATDLDIRAVKRWKVSPKLSGKPAMRSRAADACEFAQLAAKRWRHYRDTKTFATSLVHLERLIADHSQGEFCFHLKVTADWFLGILGAAMVRRTWCHHLMIDFLFVHPSICGQLVGVKAVGLQMLQSVCLLARELGCKRVWGEATLDSAPFYERQLLRPIEELFAIEKHEIKMFAARVDNPGARA
ncbi:MAG: GNAT family N-acetyltransferase [Verrucomicrobiaceae bacterium]|nr:GNAT family N-acetyltransferase [Verrucomicrobiaceae bacterium]